MQERHPKHLKGSQFLAVPDKKVQPHHSGKGTRARLDSAAEKLMFGQRSSNYKK